MSGEHGSTGVQPTVLGGGGTMEGAWINGALTATWFQIQGVERGRPRHWRGRNSVRDSTFCYSFVDRVRACHVQAQLRQTPWRPGRSKPTIVQEESQPLYWECVFSLVRAKDANKQGGKEGNRGESAREARDEDGSVEAVGGRLKVSQTIRRNAENHRSPAMHGPVVLVATLLVRLCHARRSSSE